MNDPPHSCVERLEAIGQSLRLKPELRVKGAGCVFARLLLLGKARKKRSAHALDAYLAGVERSRLDVEWAFFRGLRDEEVAAAFIIG